MHVHGQLDDAHGSRRGSHPASGSRRAASASRRHEQRHRQGRRRHQHKYDSRYRRGQHRNIHRHQRRQHGKRRRHRRRNRHPRPIPSCPNQRHARGNLHHVTNRLRPLSNGNPKRRHLHRLVERRPRGRRDDLPCNPDQRLVPGQGAHGRAHLLGRQPGKRLRPVTRGMGQLLQPGHRGPRLHLRLHGIGHVPNLLLLYGQRQKRPPKRQGDLLPARHGRGNRKRRRPPKRHADRQQRCGPVQARDKRLGIRHGAVAPRLDARPAGVRPQPQLVLGRKRPHAPPGHLRELPAHLLQAP